MVNKTVKSIFTSPSSLPPRHQAIAKSADLANRKYIHWDSLAKRATEPNGQDNGSTHTTPTARNDPPPLEETLTIRPTLPTHLRQGPLFSKQATYTATSQTNPSTSTITIIITDIPSPYQQQSASRQTLTFSRHPQQHRYISPHTHRFGDYICKFSLITTPLTPRVVSSPSSIFSSGHPTSTSIFSPALPSPTPPQGKSTARPPASNSQPTEYTLQVQLLELLAEQPICSNRAAESTTQNHRTSASWDGEKFPWQDLGTLRFLAAAAVERQDSAMAEDGVSALDMEEGHAEEDGKGEAMEAYRVVVMR
ncbi:unnamed protein product [Zymoseptoria tritici ST99CH_1A5]|uniref:Uncharacterized protein n=2 Tax=Zymoseptoria tritici TaxID=1047171 RepID=F9XP10_ZYMTI|nr:uncharacterized protein MYCGRDRAFT_97141 [Zymoseptoria tritici IPO323]EGP83076.1 hypothetical protein MYCGRDRAFT_97141 [Zymoseptoria tritici IPO323]SMY29533.1 unnamed protein product [Zymoseptoria tritici ST99CH_1A5]